MHDFQEFKSLVEEVMADVMEIAREQKLEVEPEDVTVWLQSSIKTLTDKELLLMNEWRKWFLELECTPGKDTEEIVEMTLKV